MSTIEAKLRKTVLSNIRHDLINPINAIIGYSELLLDIISTDLSILRDDIKSIHISGYSILTEIKKIFSKEALERSSISEILNNSKLQYSLRTPLTTIIGLAEFIIEDRLYKPLSDKNDIEENLKNITKAGIHLLKLTNELKIYTNNSIEELCSKYKVELNSEASSIPSFTFNPDSKQVNQQGTILLVDDEPSNLELLKKILKQSDHTVLTANNSSLALQILSDKSKNVDVILLDLIMPDVNGMEFLQQLKADNNTYHIPVIMLSALDELDTIVECINIGAEDFLMKPVNRILLRARLNNALEKKYFRDKEIKYQKKIIIEQEKSENLLLNILPQSIANRLKSGETLIADDIDNATVLFADLSGFTLLSSSISAKELVMLLNDVFTEFDELLVKYSLEKIKTIGDNYMLAGGIPIIQEDHATSVASMALEMIDIIPKINKKNNQALEIRIGINTGPLSAGVIGKKKFIYDLWGDTVNVASRMETSGSNNKIHVSETTYQHLKKYYHFKKRNKMDIPGKGLMQTYFLIGRL